MAGYLLKWALELIIGFERGHEDWPVVWSNWDESIAKSTIDFVPLADMGDPEFGIEETASLNEDSITYGEQLGIPELQLCLVAALGFGLIMDAALCSLMTKDDEQVFVNGIVLCAQAAGSMQSLSGSPMNGASTFGYPLSALLCSERHRVASLAVLRVVSTISLREALPRYVAAWTDIWQVQMMFSSSDEEHISFKPLEKLREEDGWVRESSHGPHLVYGVGTGATSECSSNSEPDSDECEPLRGYDFNEEALFDELLAMQIRLSTIIAAQEHSQEKQKVKRGVKIII